MIKTVSGKVFGRIISGDIAVSGLRLRELENMKGERLWMQKALMRSGSD